MTATAEKKRSRNQQAGSRGPGRPREFDREEGLKKAMRVFWSMGYEATSMADLRAALGTNQASLYAAYGSKEALFRETVDLYLRTDGVATPRALAAGDLSTREAVHAMLQDGVDMFVAEKVPRGCLLVLSTINCTVENKGIQDHLSSLRDRTRQSIEFRLRRGQREGDVPKAVSVKAIAAFYATVLYGLSIQARDGCGRRSLTEVVNCSMSSWDCLTGTLTSQNSASTR